MLVLAMAAPSSYFTPAIVFNALDEISNLHLRLEARSESLPFD